MLKDSEIDLVQVFSWYGNTAAIALKNYIKSLACEPLPFMDEATCRCRPDKEATSVLN